MSRPVNLDSIPISEQSSLFFYKQEHDCIKEIMIRAQILFGLGTSYGKKYVKTEYSWVRLFSLWMQDKSASSMAVYVHYCLLVKRFTHLKHFSLSKPNKKKCGERV